MSAPAVVILIRLEASPLVLVDCLNQGEDARLLDWLATRADIGEPVVRALALASRERAA